MLSSLEELNKASQLAETGQHAAVVEFLGERPREKVQDSPTLALLYGTAQARLGRHEQGKEYHGDEPRARKEPQKLCSRFTHEHYLNPGCVAPGLRGTRSQDQSSYVIAKSGSMATICVSLAAV